MFSTCFFVCKSCLHKRDLFLIHDASESIVLSWHVFQIAVAKRNLFSYQLYLSKLVFHVIGIIYLHLHVIGIIYLHLHDIIRQFDSRGKSF